MTEPDADPLAAITDDGVACEPGPEAEAEADGLDLSVWTDLRAGAE